MELAVHERKDDITHIALAGRLDATEIEQVGERLSHITATRQQPTIIDLSGIEYISSLGIGLLVANAKRVKIAGHKLVLLKPQPMVEEVLRSAKMHKVMPIAHLLEEAVRLLQTDGSPTTAHDAKPRVVADRPAPVPEPSVPATSRPSSNVLKLSIKNQIPALKALYADVDKFLEAHNIPYRPEYAVNLVLEELIVNIIHYAHLDDDLHFIDVELNISAGQIVLRIQDDGRKFDPRESPINETDLDLDGMEPGGLGLALVVDMVDVLKYERVDNKNRVEVRIHYGAD